MNKSDFKKISLMAILLVNIIGFFGCASSVNNVLYETKLKKPIQKDVIIKRKNIPADILLSLSALVMKMRHKSLHNPQVSFIKSGIHLIHEDGFKYQGFKWDMLKISKYDAVSASKNTTTFKLEGLLYFSDKIGRTTSSLFSMTYQVRNKKYIKILNSEIFDHILLSKDIRVYFIPYKAIRNNPQVFRSFRKLYIFANKNAIRIRANMREIKEYKSLSFLDKLKGRVPLKEIKGEWVALVFFMERLPSKSFFSVKLGDKDGKIYKGIKIQPHYLDYNGWIVGMIRFDGAMRSFNNPFTINTFYQKNKNSSEELIGKFSSTMDYNKYKIKNGPLSKGEILLNPSIKNDAKLIQARLFALGYYRGKIDGIFGKNSKRALGYFIKDKLHKHFNAWSIIVQKKLFRNSGL